MGIVYNLLLLLAATLASASFDPDIDEVMKQRDNERGGQWPS